MRALTTIIENGTGSRPPVILKHLLELRALGGCQGERDRLLDEALALVAAELDDMTVLAIAADAIASADTPLRLKTLSRRASRA